MTKKEEIELALLRRKRNEYAEVNTYQLFILEDRLHWIDKKINRRVKHDL